MQFTFASVAQNLNYSKLSLGGGYGLPYNSTTSSLNGNIYHFFISQDFAINKYLSLVGKGEYSQTKGKSINPDIDKLGVGGGIKIQLIPILNLVNKALSIDSSRNFKNNIYIKSGALINVNNIENYTPSSHLFNQQFIVGFEFMTINKFTYDIFIMSENYIPKNTSRTTLTPQPTGRQFIQVGVSIGFRNSKIFK